MSDSDRNKAQVFFDRGHTVAAAGQFEFAIEMYLSGLKHDPENVEIHQKLREVSLKRRAAGGKDLGMFEKMKLRGKSKEVLDAMHNAEKLLSYDPGNTDNMLALMEASAQGRFTPVIGWIGEVLMRAQTDSGKPDFNKYIKARDIFDRAGFFKEAVAACARAVEMKPGDMDLANDLKNLSAKETMHKGRYDSGGSFRDSMKDAEKQRELIESEKDFTNEDYLTRAIVNAQAELEQSPDEPGKVSKLINAYLKRDQPGDQERALEVLAGVHERTGNYRFKLAANEIRFKQLAGEERALRAQVKADPKNEEKIKAYREFEKARATEEKEIYQEIAASYPTESKYKNEVANRMFILGEYTEAIPVYQQIRQDPKLRTVATLKLGQSFLFAEYPDEAVETLRELADSYEVQDDTAKEIHYWFGRSLEASKDLQAALKSYSQVARWDFNYRDVQVRIKELRAKLNG